MNLVRIDSEKLKISEIKKKLKNISGILIPGGFGKRGTEGKIEAISALGIELSIDTWNPEIMERALDAGANFMNASDGLQNPKYKRHHL